MTDVWHALKCLLWLSQKQCNSTDMSLNRACLHTPLVYSYKCQTPKQLYCTPTTCAIKIYFTNRFYHKGLEVISYNIRLHYYTLFGGSVGGVGSVTTG